jgi:hypothetical protein
MSHVEQLEQTKYLIKIPTFKLEQPSLIPRNVLVQQTIATTLSINIPFANGLLVHGNDASF